MKKILQKCLILTIIMGILFILPNFVKADVEEIPVNGGTIYVGNTKTVSITTPAQAYYYTFVPNETTYYRFWSEAEGNVDTYGCILDNDGKTIANDDDSGNGNHFEILLQLEKDVTYKLKARLYSDESTGEFSVRLSKISTIDDGAFSTGTFIKNIQQDENHRATFTPSEDGTYRVAMESSKNTYINFSGYNNYNSSDKTKFYRDIKLEKNKTYNIEYHNVDYLADSISFSITKYIAIPKGSLKADTEYVITNNNGYQEYYEYTLNITNTNNYFLLAEYNDEVSEAFKLWVYDETGRNIGECSDGSSRLETLEQGTYTVKVFLNGSATFKFISQTVVDMGNLTVDNPRKVEFTGIAKRYTFSFTPSKSDVYDFYTDENEDTNNSTLDTYGYLFDDKGEEIDYNDDNSDIGNNNFKITRYLEQGKTYILAVETYNCMKEGTVRVNVIKSTTHEHNLQSYVTNPTCTEQGYTTRKCNACGYVIKDTYTAELGHNWYYSSVTQPTCEERGYTTHYCSRCSETMIDTYVDALGHDWHEGLTTAPTCTEKGYTEFNCGRCGTTKQDNFVDALGHDLDAGVVTAPTCTEKGYTAHHCNRCGQDNIKDTYVNALGHAYTVLSTNKATLSADGNIKKKCTRCSGEITETIFHPTKFTLSKTEFKYNDKVQKPTVTVKDSEGYVLKNGTDYTVTYSKGCKKVGKYTVTITFKGNYTGTKKLTYKINPKGTSLKSLTKGSKRFTATWKSQKTQTTGYQIEYSTSSKFSSGNKKVTIKSNKTTSKTVKKLKSKKKYYVRIRTYKIVNGTKFYSGWSKVLNVTTKK